MEGSGIGEGVVGVSIATSSTDVNANVSESQVMPEAIRRVESEEFRQALLATREGLMRIVDGGLPFEIKEEGNKYSKRVTFEDTKVELTEKMLLYAATSGTGIFITDSPKHSSFPVSTRAIAIQDRGGRGALLTIVERNASKSYIQAIELSSGTSLSEFKSRQDGALINEDEVVRVEQLEIDNATGRSESFSLDEEYRFLPEARLYHQPHLHEAVAEVLRPLSQAMSETLSSKGYTSAYLPK